MKLKLKAPGDAPSVPSTPLTETPTSTSAATATGNRPRIKLKTSQPPTPVGEFAAPQFPSSLPAQPPLATPLGPPPTKPVKTSTKKASKKRSGDDATLPPPKRTTLSLSTPRRPSIKQEPDSDELAAPTPSSAGPRISLKARKVQQPDRRDSNTRGIRLTNRKAAPPKRPIGVGYDSEASDAEEDPLVESQFVLRMQPGEDCDYLRDAIVNKTLGAPRQEGGADVSLKFLDKEHRRVIINIRGATYAAVMVDLPCIIEGMKSWDKRGWWKVADICQMMLVLGPTQSDETAKTHPLPKEVDRETWAYAHGLTPPMHYVRKRRFRKRASYRTVEHIDEEVDRLLAMDKEAEESTYKIVQDGMDDAEEAPEDEYDDQDQYQYPGDYITTTEDGYGQAFPQGGDTQMADDEDLEAQLLEQLLADGTAAVPSDTPHPPLPLADSAANLGDVETGILEAAREDATGATAALPTQDTSSAAPTPTAQPEEAPSSDEDEDDDEDDDDDDDDDEDEDDGPTAIDEDLVERERELEGQRQDIEELERRIAQAKLDIQNQKNPLLRQRKQKTLRDLDDELAVKKRAMGLGDEDDE